jgi:outer membrane protein assembly complex protein YaeT
MKKRLFKIVGIGVGVIFLLVVLIHTPPIRKAVLSYMLHRIEASTGVGFQAESLDYNLMKWRFTLKNISIYKKTGNKKHPPSFLKADQVAVVIPSPFFAQQILHLEEIALIRPEVYYTVEPGGTDNFPFQTQDESPTEIPPFIIDHLHIKDARVVYLDQVNNLHIDIPGIDTTLDWLKGEQHALSLEMQETGSLRWNSRVYPLEQFSVRAILDNRKVEFQTCTVRAAQGEIRLQGHIDNYASAAPDLDLTLEARFLAGDLADLLPGPLRIPGTLAVESHFYGSLADLAIKIRFNASDFLFSQPVAALVSGTGVVFAQGFSWGHLRGTGNFCFAPPPAPGVAGGKPVKRGIPLEGGISFELQPDRLLLDVRQLRSGGITARGRWEKNPTGMKGELLLDVPDLEKSLRQVRALRLEPGLNRVITAALEAGVEGNTTLKVSLNGSLDSPLVSAELNAFLPVKSLEPFRVHGKGSYTRGIVRVTGLEIRQAQQVVQVTGVVPAVLPKGGSPPVILTLRGEHIDTASLQPFLGGEVLFKGVVSFAASLKIDTAKNRINAQVEQLEIQTEGQALKNQGPFHLVLDPAGLTVKNLALAGSETSIRAEGHLCRREIKGPSYSPFTVTADIDSRLLRAFFPALSASGTIKFKGEMEGCLSQPLLTGRLDLEEGTASIEGLPAPFQHIDLHLRLAGEEVTVDVFTFAWQEGQFSLTGRLGKEFSLSLGARNLSTAMIAPYLPPGWSDKVKGSMDADFNIKGQRPELAALSGSGTLRQIRFSLGGSPFQQVQPAQLTLTNGTVKLENLSLSGPESSLQATATIQLTAPYPLEAEAGGEINSRVLESLWEEATFSGTNRLHFQVTGDLSNPLFSGEILLQNGGIQQPEYRLYISGIKGKIGIGEGKLKILESITGGFNGGDFQITAGDPWGIRFKGVKLDIPLGLLSEAGGTLTLEPRVNGSPGYKLKGSIAIANGLYKEPYSIGSQLYRYLRQSTSRLAMESPEAAMVPLEIDINLYTESPIRVDNNIARAEISAALKLSGPAANPVLAGRAELKTGGEIYLGKNTFYIERGTVNFLNPARVEPELDISARTRVGDHEIRLSLTGTLQALSASLTSTPPLPEANIIALLVSGKPIENTSPSLLSEAGNITLTYLGGAITGKIEEAVRQTLGLETLRVDGSLVASKEDPGARLTVGEHLTDNLEVIFSQSLRRSQDRTWIVNWDPLRELNLQATRQDDNAYSLAVNHRIRFGLKGAEQTPLNSKDKTKSKSAAAPAKISEITISGNPRVPGQVIKKKLKLKTGKPFQFFKFQEGLKRIRRYYRRLGYLNVQLTTRKEEEQKKIRLFLEIEAGPWVFLGFRGAPVPRGVHRQAKETWMNGQYDQQRIDTITGQLRQHFLKKRYYKVDIRNETESDADGNTHTTFRIARGGRYKPLELKYLGNRYRTGRQLSALLKGASLLSTVLAQPGAAARYLGRWYRQEGFLAAVIPPPEIQWREEDRRVTVVFDIAEGPRFKIGEIHFSGNRFLDSQTLSGNLGLRTGDPMSAQKLDAAAAALENLYAAKGFYDTRVTVQPQPNQAEARVTVSFTLAENPRRRIKEVRIRGNQVTRTFAIRRELSFKNGDLLDLKILNKSRKNLYDMGVFERVNIEVVPEPGQGEQKSEQSCIIDVEVKEQKPYLLKYGLQWNTETGAGVTGEFDHLNFTGSASLLGAAFSYNKKEQDARLYSRFPYFLGKKINTELFLFAHHQEEPRAAVGDRLGITLQQQYRPTRKSLFSIGYTFEKYRADTAVNLGHLTAAFTFDSRNRILNASRGLFISQSFQYAGKFLGSQATFSRYTAQYSIYKRVIPRLVLAASLQLGLGKGLGQALLPGERFFAGGGSTLRGFKYNSVGPLDPVSREPEGGEALFIFKQELRLQLNPDLGAVLFLDLGNVYTLTTDFDPFNVRKAAGFGLRFNLSGLLLRLDWGFKLDRRPGESPSQIFFGIGQSF